MKTARLSIIALVLMGALSCKKDASTTTSAAVTTDQAADIAAGSLAENSNGFTSITDDISSNATGQVAASTGLTINSAGTNTITKQLCGTTVSDSLTNQGSADSVTWSYFRKYTHTLNCNASEKPDNIVNTLAFNGSYSGPNLSSNDSGSANVTIGHLEPDSATFLVNGEYKRSGSFTSKVGNKASGSRSVDIVVTNVTLSKPARKITGGTATINISVTLPKKTYTFTGTITFNGDGSAVLTINGTAYTIDLRTGFRMRR